MVNCGPFSIYIHGSTVDYASLNEWNDRGKIKTLYCMLHLFVELLRSEASGSAVSPSASTPISLYFQQVWCRFLFRDSHGHREVSGIRLVDVELNKVRLCVLHLAPLPFGRKVKHTDVKNSAFQMHRVAPLSFDSLIFCRCLRADLKGAFKLKLFFFTCTRPVLEAQVRK